MYKDMPGLLKNPTPKIHIFKSILDLIEHLENIGLYKKDKRFSIRHYQRKEPQLLWVSYIVELGQLPLGYADSNLIIFKQDLLNVKSQV